MGKEDTDRPWMRVQLQRDDEHYDSLPLRPINLSSRNPHVTVMQAITGVRAMARSKKLPKSEVGRAELVVRRAVKWIEAKRPYGWAATDGHSFEFERTNAYEGFRIDLECLNGVNLLS